MAHDQQNDGAFIGGAFQDFVKKLHRTWRVGQRAESAMVKGRNEEASRDPDGFGNVLVLLSIAFVVGAMGLGKDDN